MHKLIALCAVTAIVVGGGTATAARLITGKNIKDGSITGRDLARNSVSSNRLSPGIRSLLSRQQAASTSPGAPGKDGTSGKDGASGANGTNGANGANGASGTSGSSGSTGAQGPAGPSLPTVAHLLYVKDGAKQIAYVSYTLKDPIALKDFNLTFFQERVFGNGNFGANVILGVDANNDGKYDADDLGWHHSPSATLLKDDSFVEMDAAPPSTVKVDAPSVPQWYSADQAGTGIAQGNGCYATLPDLLANCDTDRVNGDMKVYVVRLVVGGSSSWQDDAIRVTAPGQAGDVTSGLSQ